MKDFDEALASALTALDQSGRRRHLRAAGWRADKASPTGFTLDGRPMVNFSSNDYLGLSHHPALIARAIAFTERWGTGSGASRLVCGNLEPYEEIEAKLARGKGAEAALVLASGFQANAALLPALLDRDLVGADPLVFTDRLNHASLHLGLKAAGVRQIRYRHNDLNHLEELLRAQAGRVGFRLIITESVFSMDGDRADIAALSQLAQSYGALLYVDEAHATGVLGENGFGLCSGHPVDLVMGTFSKGLGSFGAYVACSARLRDYFINRCAGLIYATALPPPVLGAIDAALDLVPDLGPEREYLQNLAEGVRQSLRRAGLETGPSSTQIVPVILGAEQRALDVARALEQAGFLGVAIRPPTVPAGTARLRLTFSAAHTPQQAEDLVSHLVELTR